MSGSTILEVLPHEQDWMLAALRRAQCRYLLALPVLLLCTTGWTPTEIAAFLFCSRSSGHRIVKANKTQPFPPLVPFPSPKNERYKSLRQQLIRSLQYTHPSYYIGTSPEIEAAVGRQRFELCHTLSGQKKPIV